MAEFLGTTATNYQLEELIKNTSERLILISPFLNVNDRLKELLIDKDRLKIDMRLVYGKSELQPQEITWIKNLTYLRTSFCQNLHAKCYLNENVAIITSMNLYEFSQINNNEMGVLVKRKEDEKLHKDIHEEALRIIRISKEIRLSADEVDDSPSSSEENDDGDKIPTSKIAVKMKMSTADWKIFFASLGI
jgi:phosphatidylserine/phosphatidylglycerophosphate/cardiolipin synthase-like enzyme